MRMLVLLTFRPEFTPPWPLHSHIFPLTLSRFLERHVRQIAERVAGGKMLPSEVVQQLVQKADGVPLFVEEMTKNVLESGVLREANGQYELTGPLTALAIPATLQDSLMARLDRLNTAREVAQLGAVIGREFSYRILHALSFTDETTLQHGLSQLVEAELVYQRGVLPESQYMFKHALIQDAAYQSLLKSKRQQVHRQVAQVLEERAREAGSAQPELLAHHFTEAALLEKAVPYWQQAGEQAVVRSANAEAIRHIEQGITLVQTLAKTLDTAEQELRLQLLLGQVLIAMRGWSAAEVESAYARAQELCQQVGQTPQEFVAQVGLWVFHLVRGDLPLTRELAEQLLDIANSTQEVNLLIPAHQAIGVSLLWLGDVVQARKHLETGAALYEPEKHSVSTRSYGTDMGVVTLAYLAGALWVLGYPDRALGVCREAVSLAERLSHPHSVAFALTWKSQLHYFRRESRTAEEEAEAAIVLAHEHGFPFWLTIGTMAQGWALAKRGKKQEGLAQIRQGLAEQRTIGASGGLGLWLAVLADACLAGPEAEEGLAAVAEARTLSETSGEQFYAAELLRLKGELLLSKDERQTRQTEALEAAAEAEGYFQHAIEIAQRQQAKSLELRAATSLARLWQQQGKVDEAGQMLSEIYGWFTEGFDTQDLQEAKELLKELS